MRVAIAHPSAASLRALKLALAKMPSCELVWTASGAASALQSAGNAPPELLLLDASFVGPSSAEIVRKLKDVCAVVLLSDASERVMALVYDGMSAGAIDVALCPTLTATGQLTDDDRLLAKLKSVQSVLGASAPPPPRVQETTRLVLIGCSTGGPQALQVILSRLSRDLNAAYLVAQHVDVTFSGGLADWLDRETALTVRIAPQGGVPLAHTVLIAGTNDHLVLDARRRLTYTKEPEDVPFRPSADALFSSAAAHWPAPGVAVLLTGMGRDGGQGMLKLRQAGWHTIAQDAATSVVFGMPRAAIELGAAQEVLPLMAIADAIANACRTHARGPQPRGAR